jgi:uncharacterized protein
MRLDDEKPSTNIEDRRGQSGGFGGPGGDGGFGPMGGRGGGFNIPMGGRGGMSLSTIVLLAVAYLALKLLFGIDLLQMLNGGGGGGLQFPDTQSQIQLPGSGGQTADAQGPGAGTTGDVTADAGREFVARVLGSTERVWGTIFQQMGKTYEPAPLVLFNGFTRSGCGSASSQMGPFYCPRDAKVYIDLSFYQDMKNKLGAPGDFAQAYVVAHEIGHHVQDLLGIAEQVTQQRAQASETESNVLSVKMELQADCLAGIWAAEADATKHILQQGDIEEALNAASQIGDDRLQKRSTGQVVPDTFTHGTSEQRVRWFKAGLTAKSLNDCDTFAAANL